MVTSKRFAPRERKIGRFAAELRESMPERISLDARQQIDVTGQSTPALIHGNLILNLDCSIPDRFTERTGVTATIFVKRGADFIRVSTSVKKQNGERAMGTALSHAHPAYARLMAGDSYVGYATLFGTQYLTQYDAIRDDRGEIIGALYVGIDVSGQHKLSLAARLAIACFVLSSALFTAVIWSFASRIQGALGPSDEIAAARSTYLAIAVFLALLISGGLYQLLHTTLSKALLDARNVAQRLAAGDLTSQLHVDRNDEIGQVMQAINGISQGLTDIVGNVRRGSGEITAASREIASGNADLSARTSEQAASLEETAASMAELTTTVRENAENAQQANRLVVTSSTVAATGRQVVERVVAMMDAFKRSSERIEKIVGEIEDIAFQTNILALNAAVEAARAGEHGRSFTVVAVDVRNLAQRSGTAAKEIKSLIADSVAQISDGSALAAEAGKTMKEIVTSVKRVADIMGEISAASEEQSGGIEQVNLAIAKMDEMTQQNAALVEQAAAAAESLHTQAEKLSDVVAVFKLP